jgi:hypothetical protein
MSTVTCEGPPLSLPENGGADPCVDEYYYVLFMDNTVRIMGGAISPIFFAGWTPWLELIRDDTGGISARMCAIPFTDDLGGGCPDGERHCATAGSVAISRWPAGLDDDADLSLRVDATFENGFRFRADIDVYDRP